MKLTACRYDTGEPCEIVIEQGCIASLTPVKTEQADDLPWVAPGFCDLQVNGYGGIGFNDPQLSEEGVAEIVGQLAVGGVTQFCPTVVTGARESITNSLKVLAKSCRQAELKSSIVGIHLEGPYISPHDGPRGAHPQEHCRPPDWEEFEQWQQAAEGNIRIVTLSPEYENSAEFIAAANSTGVVVAIGHTAANSEQISAAVEAGAKLSTHLGNGAHGMIARHPNYIWDQLADDRLLASLIVDGHHLPPAVVKSFVRGKEPARCILVSDITEMAGRPPGVYQTPSLGAVEVLPGGKLVVAGQRQYLAGAALPLATCIGNVMDYAGVSLATAIDMASLHPRRLLGIPGGRLEIGADIALFRLTGKNLVVDHSAIKTKSK